MASDQTAYGSCVCTLDMFYTFDPSLFSAEDEEEDRQKERMFLYFHLFELQQLTNVMFRFRNEG